MSSPALSRLAVRQSRFFIQRRSASTTSDAATAAKETAQNTASKAQQGLSRVTSSAGPALSKAASGVSNSLSKVGGRTGALIHWVQGLIPHVVYYGKVTGELGRIIYQNRGMQPPNAQTVQNAIAPLKKAISNPSSVGAQTARAAEKSAQQAVHQPQSFLEKVRNMDAATLTSAGVVAAETIGFFSVGEMIGRFKIIGYRSTGAHAHH